MASFRKIALSIVQNGAARIPSKFLQQLANQKLILPFYHAISDKDCPHIKHLYSVKGRQAFIDDLDFLLKYYRPIGYPEFRSLKLNNEQPKEPSFLLTFDDGLSEYHDVIAPILLEKGIPAICFLNSGFVDNKNLFYRYKASLLVDEIKKEPRLKEKLSSVFNNGKYIVQNILSVNYQNKSILDEIAGLIGFDFKKFLAESKPYLSSDQIRSLINQGFHFGAHSIDHPRYAYLGLEEQLRQTKESMQFIQEQFSLDYKLFSFPFADDQVSSQFFTKIQEAGIADFTFGTAGQKKDPIFNNFQRIPFEKSNYSAATIHNFELLYYLIKAPLFKNTVRRK